MKNGNGGAGPAKRLVANAPGGTRADLRRNGATHGGKGPAGFVKLLLIDRVVQAFVTQFVVFKSQFNCAHESVS
jgi:hypothetical protein